MAPSLLLNSEMFCSRQEGDVSLGSALSIILSVCLVVYDLSASEF